MNGKVTVQETVHAPRKVAWLQIGKTYQIRTRSVIFALAKVTHKENGSVDIAFFGASQSKYLRRPSTPLWKTLQPTLQAMRLPINTITEAREVV